MAHGWIGAGIPEKASMAGKRPLAPYYWLMRLLPDEQEGPASGAGPQEASIP